MKAALLIVDFQYDFLERPGLTPPAAALTRGVSRLLEACRNNTIPVIHAHSIYSADGEDRMPHWKRDDYRACVEGSRGAATPSALTPTSSEKIIVKKYFSAFSNPELQAALDDKGIDTLIIAGIYSHACVRAAVLDAYQNGLRVWVASEAIGSIDSLMSETSRGFLEGRAASYLTTDEILRRLQIATGSDTEAGHSPSLPVARIKGEWIDAGDRQRHPHLDPCDPATLLDNVAVGTEEDAEAAVSCAQDAAPVMASLSEQERAGILNNLSIELGRRRDQLLQLIGREIGKSRTDTEEEFERALAHIQSTGKLLKDGAADMMPIDAHTRVRRRPLGLIAIITPWNNPLAIPLGKIAPALAFGNSAVWKPAMEAPRTAMALMECLQQAGVPAGAVNLLFGDAATAQALITRQAVAAVTLTGSTDTGKLVAAECGRRLIPLQAELGGNNAALVMAGCDLEATAHALAELSFSFSGQRCTSLRRIIVEKSIAAEFTGIFSAAVQALPIGPPTEPHARITPLISTERRQQVSAAVDNALREGAQLICGGRIPPGYTGGCWYEPTLLQVSDRSSHLLQHETFGPVALLHPVQDFESALQACNAVSQGLVAALYSADTAQQREFLNRAEAGILRINPGKGTILPQAPFGGWKDSGFGVPEHGACNLEFYTRLQTIYD